MGWYHEDWLFRQPLAIDNNTVGNVSGVNEPELSFGVPSHFGKFWENCQDDFDDIRLTAADGVTLLDWKFNGTPSKANRSMFIHVDNTFHNVATLYGGSNAAANATVGMHLYWGNSDTNVSGANNNTSINTQTAKSVNFVLRAPGSSANDYVLRCYKPTPDQLYPNHRIRKQINDDVRIYWDLSACVGKLARRNNLSLRDEEIAYVKAQISDQDGNDTTTAMTSVSDIGISPDYVVSMPIKGGDHDKRYLITMTFALVDTHGFVRVIDQRATLLVSNLGLHPS